jgi:peptidoglycan L-alanyl-D-glutamate endopeptidase CwlK
MSKALESLEPDFRNAVERLLFGIQGVTGRTWVVTSGRRTMEEQRRIYAQGRTTAGNIVSNAPAGSSPHNFGLGADLAPLKVDSTEIDWNAPRDKWKLMADLAQEMGLVAGFYFHTITDMPHVEAANWKAQQALWKDGKINVA